MARRKASRRAIARRANSLYYRALARYDRRVRTIGYGPVTTDAIQLLVWLHELARG